MVACVYKKIQPEMVVQWNIDVSVAPKNEHLVVWKQGGIGISWRDDLGNWRDRHNGRPKTEPVAWMYAFDGPEHANPPMQPTPPRNPTHE